MDARPRGARPCGSSEGRPLTLASLLAAAVWLSCPAHQYGDAYPVLAQEGCPVPVSGLIYPHGHEDERESARLALTRSAAALRACAVDREAEAEEWSPAVWLALGAAVGAVAGVGLTR